ncbi:MAG: OmpW/AlkL family protein [Pseudomonadota bacterium]
MPGSPLWKLITFAGCATVFIGASPLAQAEDSPWQVRARAIVVTPDESADISTVGGDVNIDTAVMPEVDISYFFTDNIAVELILGVSPHDITAVDTVAGAFPVGSSTLLPPTLTLQYHLPLGGRIKPYVGAGINYTMFLDEDAKGAVVNRMNLKNSFGWAAQVGVDVKLDDHWFVNADAKKLWLDTTARLETAVGPVSADVDINPWILGFGFGYRF